VLLAVNALEDRSTNECQWDLQECINPFGAYRLKYEGSVSTQCGSLRNEAEWNEFKKEVVADDQVEYFQLSRFVEGQIVVEHVI